MDGFPYWGREQAQGLKSNFLIRRIPRSHICIYMHHHNGLISDPGTDLQSKALIALTFEHVRAFTICAYHLSNILIVSVLIMMFALLRSIRAMWVSTKCTCLWNCGLCPSLESVIVQLCIRSILIVIGGFFLHVFVVVINCICQVVTCVVQLCVVFILILIGGQRDQGVSPTTYFISLGCM